MKKTRPVSIIDVAEKAGLSQATVSRVLNRSGYFSPDTQARVDQAVEALGYTPNRMARGLKGKSSGVVGLIIPDITNVFYTSVSRSIMAILEKSGYEMVLCVNEEDVNKDLAYLKLLEQKNVDGILYAHPAGGSNSTTIHRLVNSGIPIVEVNRRRENGFLDSVLPDNSRGVKQVIEYLHGLGHTRIAMISGSEETTTGVERLEGYQNSLTESGIPIDKNLIKIGRFCREHGEQAMMELLDLDEKNRPTAVFAASNRIALGALYILGQRKIQIPGDLSVAVFDDTEWLAAWNPPITTVDIAIHEMSQLAVDLLMRRINQPDQTIKPVVYHLGTSLIVRQSCTAVH